MTAGYAVYGFPATSDSDRAVHRLFDVRRLGIAAAPRGIAYITSQRRFALADTTQPSMLFTCDDKGDPFPPTNIGYLNDYQPVALEALAYIPPTSPTFPDHLVLMTSPDFVEFRLEVLRLDGQVVAEIHLPDIVSRTGYASAVAYASPDRLLVGAIGEIWTIDFAGNVVGGPVLSNPDVVTEGLIELRDGRIVATDGAKLRFYDAGLNRLADDDRDAGVGAHLVFPTSAGWDSDASQHLVDAPTEISGGGGLTEQIAAIPPSLRSATRLFDIGTHPSIFARASRGVTYLSDEHLIAVSFRRRGSTGPAIDLYDSAGALIERISLAAIASPQFGFAYIPSTRQFALTTAFGPRLKIVNRDGTLARQVDFSAAGVQAILAVAYFNSAHPSGGEFMVVGIPPFGDGNRAVITDFNGNLIDEFNYRDELGLTEVVGVSAITTGPYAGAFGAVDFEGSELVVFRLR